MPNPAYYMLLGLIPPSGGGGGTPGVATSIFFIDGADHVTNANDKWDSDNPAIAASEAGAHGRCYDNSSLRVRRAVTAQPTYSAGVRFKLTSDVNDNILRFMDTVSQVQIGIRYLAGGSLEINRGNTSTQLAVSAAGLINIGTWYKLEATATIDNTTGSAQVKLYDDGTNALIVTVTFASGDTQSTANAHTNLIDFGSINANSFTEDMWIDSSGALYGPLRVETLYPNGNGATNQWSRAGTDSGANWSQVDEAQNNDTTDYVTEALNNRMELYTYPARSLTGAIYAVQASPVAAISGSVGGLTFRAVCRIAGVNYFGATITLSTTWITRPHCWGTSPATGLGWSSAELASAQFGFERVAGTESTVEQWVTQAALEIICAA